MVEGLNVVSTDGRRPARAGYDHTWYDFTPLKGRLVPHLPGSARVAVSVVLDVVAVEWELMARPVVPPLGGRGFAPPPDFPRMSHREYGHRVGVFRLLDMLRKTGIEPAAIVDVLTAERYPALLRHLLPQVGEVIAGGLSGSRPITSRMHADEERHYVGLTMERLERALGCRPAGWVSPERSESHRTPGLLAEAGLGYVGDWGNDEQPYHMTGAGSLWSYPLSWELADVNASQVRGVAPRDYARSLEDAVDEMAQDSAAPRVLGLQLQPWSAGQAYRAAALKTALTTLRERDDVWWATPSAILACWRGTGAVEETTRG